MGNSYFTSDAKVASLLQEGLLEHYFGANLRNPMNWRGLYTPKQWMDRATQIMRTKRGSIAAKALPLPFSTDPSDATFELEQWPVDIKHFANTIPTDLLESGLTLAELVPQVIEGLARSFSLSANVLARYPAMNAALAGQTTTSTADTSMVKVVASINGFCFARDAGNRLSPVSSLNTLKVWVYSSATWTSHTLISAVPTTPGLVTGPGTLTFTGGNFTTVNADLIVADTASYRVISSGGLGIDSITAGDVIADVEIKTAVARLRQMGVPTFADGLYKLILSPSDMAQLLGSSPIQLMLRGRGLNANDMSNPEVSAQIYNVLGCRLIEDAYADPSTYPASVAAGDYLDAPKLNASNVPLSTALVVGNGGLTEDWKDAMATMNPAGYNGSVGDFGKWAVNDQGVETNTDRCRLILRAPIDKVQQVIQATWSYVGGYSVATDFTSEIAGGPLVALTGSNSAYKTIVPIIHAA